MEGFGALRKRSQIMGAPKTACGNVGGTTKGQKCTRTPEGTLEEHQNQTSGMHKRRSPVSVLSSMLWHPGFR